ncbi:hypothetical protein AC579_1297 [Pseudocercospora musae]|uniref:Uncharacterized protein n=1 Tax=Pseudocercospora musae TaxID=113226 RepID=A0A139I0G6_9PEZI|nr:hypothetical protein AC579_1297 [Pseudocercospora musae]
MGPMPGAIDGMLPGKRVSASAPSTSTPSPASKAIVEVSGLLCDDANNYDVFSPTHTSFASFASRDKTANSRTVQHYYRPTSPKHCPRINHATSPLRRIKAE